jgi:hypothetical protein
MPRLTTIVFYNITSISEIMFIGDGAKGLRLHNFQGIQSCRIRTDIFTKEKKRGKIKAIYRKL